ncbi:hypothetical protein AVEN_64332-1 [Araneus ventricosus]|uniref:Uncharacterized protein n=1 Tax=Araneus ventricosus TaxID=182803 RepID=A0A4Y2DB50_ARAVE|nr:hypothetical protein AVEN_64332-1 [Araneus ventricosus]
MSVPALLDGTSQSQANKVFEIDEELGLSENISALRFDITASNIEWKNGACVQLENHLRRKLLSLACRKHAFELLEDDRNYIREFCLRRIMAARARKSIALRKFTIPDFNFEAEHYHELIDWQNWEKTEPPLTMGISDEALKQMVVDGEPVEVFDSQN